MKRLFAGLLIVQLVGLAGCGGTGSPGGPGATNSGKGSLVGPGENEFTLDVPNLSTSIKQGEAKQMSIGIKRGKNFDQDVTLKFDDVPKGVSFEPASPVIKKSDKEVKFTVKAADDAAVNDYTVKVTGKPEKGPDATNEFKLSVKQK